MASSSPASGASPGSRRPRLQQLAVVARDGGIFLPEVDLWLDPGRAKPVAFVSHAHADHFARHGRTLCSPATAEVLQTRFGRRTACEPIAFGDVREVNGHRLELLPAGHALGSAQIRVERLSDGASLLYTGDFKRRACLTCEPYQSRTADTLIMETTFGLPKFQFPPTGEVRSALLRFCQETLEDGDVPVLFGYSFGKAQELLAILAASGLETMAHDSIRALLPVFEAHGCAFPPCEPFDPKRLAGKVLVFPPAAARSVAIRRIRNRRTAMASGWALQPGAKFRYQVDDVFPLSDHADWPDLLRCVEEVRPQRVLTTHGFAAEFAAELRRRGIDAWSLEGSDQLELPIATEALPVSVRVSGGPAAGKEPPCAPDSFRAFAATCGAVAQASGRGRKTALLAGHLAGLDGDDVLADSVRFFSARAAENRGVQGRLQAGWSVVRMALLALTGIPAQRYRQVSQSQNDAGRTAQLLLEEGAALRKTRAVTIADVRAFLRELAAARGPVAKAARLQDLLGSLTPEEGRCLVGIVTGDLRIGLKDGLLEEAIAAAFASPAADVRQAHMLTGDLGETALLARRGKLQCAGVRPFQPVRPMLASPEETAGALLQRLSGHDGSGTESESVPAHPSSGVWLEDKFDGIRAQLHLCEGRCGIYSRDLRPLTGEFPELARAAVAIGCGVVLDGEIIAWNDDGSLGFFDLQKRLGRRERDLFLQDEVPVRFVAFDILWHDGTSLLNCPLLQRRKRLESLVLPPSFALVEVIRAQTAGAVETAFSAARRRGNEGLIAKNPASFYTAGRRGKSWLKLKKAAATLDVVVVRAEQGHGKRSHVLSDYTFAVRDEASGALRIVGKAYSGLTDLEIEELTGHFKARTIEKRRRVHFVEPDTVLEVAFDSIRPSKRHDSGLAMRFPRIKAIRRDKSPAEIDSLAYARRLAGVSSGGE